MPTYVYRRSEIGLDDILSGSGVAADSIQIVHKDLGVIGPTIEYAKEIRITRAAGISTDERAAWDAHLSNLGYVFDRQE